MLQHDISNAFLFPPPMFLSNSCEAGIDVIGSECAQELFAQSLLALFHYLRTTIAAKPV
jgi:hypothetical protein